MTDTKGLTIDNLIGRKPKSVEITKPESKEPETKEPESNEPEQVETDIQAVEPKTKRDTMSDEVLGVMLSDEHLEKMTHLNSKGAMTFARADTMAEIFECKTLKRFTTKAKQHLVSNKRLGRTEIGDVLNNVGETVDDSKSMKEKMFGDQF